jgi:hypothetical protein
MAFAIVKGMQQEVHLRVYYNAILQDYLPGYQ